MRYMLATNICIYAIKKKPMQVLERMHDHLDGGLGISAITLAELVHGTEKSARQERNQAALLQFLTILEVLPFNDRVEE